MAFNINEFRSNISKSGYLQNNKYEVIITSPPAMQKRGIARAQDAAKLMTFRTSTFEAPGIELKSVDIIRYGTGTSQKMPFSAKFEDITFEVLLDKNSELWNFWYEWERLIFKFSPFNSVGLAPYVTEYKRNYATTIDLKVYSQEDKVSAEFKFIDIYPISIKEVELQWEEQSKLAKLEITMNYKEYTLKTTTTP